MLVAGVDCSTQSTKVVLCHADDGTVIGAGSAPHPDGTECDPRAWWDALLVAGRGMLDDLADGGFPAAGDIAHVEPVGADQRIDDRAMPDRADDDRVGSGARRGGAGDTAEILAQVRRRVQHAGIVGGIGHDPERGARFDQPQRARRRRRADRSGPCAGEGRRAAEEQQQEQKTFHQDRILVAWKASEMEL